MAKLSAKPFKIVIGVVVVAIVAGVAWFAFLRPSPTRTVTADFPEAVGIYPGTPVRILGVNVGQVDGAEGCDPARLRFDRARPGHAYHQLPADPDRVHQVVCVPGAAPAVQVAERQDGDAQCSGR